MRWNNIPDRIINRVKITNPEQKVWFCPESGCFLLILDPTRYGAGSGLNFSLLLK